MHSEKECIFYCLYVINNAEITCGHEMMFCDQKNVIVYIKDKPEKVYFDYIIMIAEVLSPAYNGKFVFLVGK